jgi:hypothetical protein
VRIVLLGEGAADSVKIVSDLCMFESMGKKLLERWKILEKRLGNAHTRL